MITDMTPFYPSLVYKDMEVVINELIQADAKLFGLINKVTAKSLFSLVEIMNCYYSNMIEGHKTLPIEIEQAISSSNESKQSIVVGHILAQRYAMENHALPMITLSKKIHESFYEKTDEKERTLENGELMIAGRFRKLNVKVGHHIPPDYNEIPEYMEKLSQEYKIKPQSSLYSNIVSAFCAHHKFVWVHPFADGNGRTARILLDAMLVSAGLKGVGLWSMSRGYARNSNQYKALLSQADLVRQGSMDGRGNLSEKALVAFVTESAAIARDQAEYMYSLFGLENIDSRMNHYFSNIRIDLGKNAYQMYKQTFLEGEVDRGKLTSIAGSTDRTERKTLKALLDEGFLVSDSPKGRVRCAFPVSCLAYLFPDLFPPRDLEYRSKLDSMLNSKVDDSSGQTPEYYFARIFDDNFLDIVPKPSLADVNKLILERIHELYTNGDRTESENKEYNHLCDVSNKIEKALSQDKGLQF